VQWHPHPRGKLPKRLRKWLAARELPRSRIDAAISNAPNDLVRTFGYRPGNDAAGERLTSFYGFYQAIRPLETTTLEGYENRREATSAAEAYALALAAQCTLKERLATVPKDGYRPDLEVTTVEQRMRDKLILDPLLQRHEKISQQRPEMATQSAEQLIAALYAQAVATIDELPSRVKAVIENTPLEIDGTTYCGLKEYAGVSGVKHSQTGIGLERVVGNKDAIAGLRIIGMNLLRYDTTTGKNPYIAAGGNIPLSTLLTGPSGTGKSLVARLWTEEMQEAGARLGKIVSVPEVSNRGKTKMQNSAGEWWSSLIKDIQGEGIFLPFGDEIDGTLPSERASDDERYFEQLLLADLTALKLQNKGNIHFISTSNKSYESLSRRLRTRLGERHYHLLGPETPGEHSRLFQLSLEGMRESGLVAMSPKEWEEVGVLSKEAYTLNGREIKLISEELVEQVTGGGYDGTRSLVEAAPQLATMDSTAIRESWKENGMITKEKIGSLMAEKAARREADRIREASM
jgi:hypothetical protein